MDALEFIKYLKKMCAQYGVENQKHAFCQGCPALTEEDEICIANFQFESCVPNKAVEAVEKYAKENPIKTRSSEFLKYYPIADVLYNGVVNICPKRVDKSYNLSSGCNDTNCYGCKTEYWTQEVEGE